MASKRTGKVNLQVDYDINTAPAEQALNRVAGASRKVGQGMGAAGSATGNAANEMLAMGTAGKRANIVLLDSSRLIEDSVWGIRAMSNNFSPLLLSFQRLREDAGSGSAALKVMLKGLTGPAGLLVAVSILSTLAVTFGPKLGAMFGKGNQKELSAYKDYIKSINEEITKHLEKLKEVKQGEAYRENTKYLTQNLLKQRELNKEIDTQRDKIKDTVQNEETLNRNRRAAYSASINASNKITKAQEKLNEKLEEELSIRAEINLSLLADIVTMAERKELLDLEIAGATDVEIQEARVNQAIARRTALLEKAHTGNQALIAQDQVEIAQKELILLQQKERNELQEEHIEQIKKEKEEYLAWLEAVREHARAQASLHGRGRDPGAVEGRTGPGEQIVNPNAQSDFEQWKQDRDDAYTEGKEKEADAIAKAEKALEKYNEAKRRELALTIERTITEAASEIRAAKNAKERSKAIAKAIKNLIKEIALLKIKHAILKKMGLAGAATGVGGPGGILGTFGTILGTVFGFGGSNRSVSAPNVGSGGQSFGAPPQVNLTINNIVDGQVINETTTRVNERNTRLGTGYIG